MTEFYIKVRPGEERFDIDTSGTYPVVDLESPAEKGRANEELVHRLSEIFGEEAGIVSGHHSRRKKMIVEMPEKEIEEILEDCPG
ncbi:MAG: DUF167 domain-containing protein [Candidatus Nanohaloarchaeota archaeon QJJ-7]|nr:DUF167 domain-containing protein [Candidatus Nanohaloarchaeota archaeon QJJ-7]